MYIIYVYMHIYIYIHMYMAEWPMSIFASTLPPWVSLPLPCRYGGGRPAASDQVSFGKGPYSCLSCLIT